MIVYALNQAKSLEECFNFLEAMADKHGDTCAGWYVHEMLEVEKTPKSTIKSIYVKPSPAIDKMMVYTSAYYENL